MPVPAGSPLGPYEVVEPLGAGGMGEVYRARDCRLGRDVAIKVLHEDVSRDADRLTRFDQEARAVAALNHPNILTVHDVGTHEGMPYVVSELLEGESLREVLTRRSPTQRQVLTWAVQAAHGLAAAHQKGIVHRDVKPENLFLTSDGRIKILDFGLAKQVSTSRVSGESEAVTAASPTEAGVVMGTVAYMSPEQLQALAVDARSDIFSFGVVLYELLARKHPFRRDAVSATVGAILQETPPPLTNLDATIPRALDGIVTRCLEKNKENRFHGAHDLGLALEAVLAAPSGSAVLDEVDERSPYPGLSSFTERDAAVFFGREAEIKAVWDRIRGRRLLAVIGPSGAGKTSFLRAGVLPARGDGWAAVVASPGSSPFRGLGQALASELAGDTEALRDLVNVDDPETAFRLVARWRKARAEALLVLDQFEELFTLNATETQARFAALLGRIAREADVHVLLSLRDDFLMRCHDQAALAPVFEGLTPLGALTTEGLRRALVEPARRRGYRFENEALVEEMIESVDGARAALPLLAFAVARVWEKKDREGRLLTREAYEDVGGVAGALAQHAEATLDAIGGERQGLVREMFRNLVTAQGTRAVIDRDELLSAFAERAAAEEVLRQLIDARLLTTYEADGKEDEPRRRRVEVVHESLLKAWPRLVRWQTQDEEGSLLRDQLKQAAHLWDDKGRTGDLLWTGTAYQEFELWRGRYPGALTALEGDFARSMADKARRKRRLVGAVAVAAVVVSTGVAIAIAVSRHEAVVAAGRAEASKLLAIAQLKLQTDPTETLAYATASLELADTADARLMALRATQQAPPAWEISSRLIEGIQDSRRPAFSPDGRYLAVGAHSSVVGVWSENGDPPVRLMGHATGSTNSARWASPTTLVTGGPNARQVHVWVFPGSRKRTVDFGGWSRWFVGVDRLFAETPEGSGDLPLPAGGLLRMWRLPDGDAELLGRVDAAKLGMGRGFYGSRFEPYGRGWLYTTGRTTHILPLPVGRERERVFSQHFANSTLFGFLRPDVLATRDETGESRLFVFPERGEPVVTTFRKPASAPADVGPEPGGRWLTGQTGVDPELRLWDVAALPGARALRLQREGSWYASESAVAPGSRVVVATTNSLSRLTFWPLPGRSVSVVEGYNVGIRPLAFSPDSRWLATSWEGGRIRLWPLPGTGVTQDKVMLDEGNPPWTSLRFDPRGRYLFAVGTLSYRIIPLDGSPTRPLPAGSMRAMVFDAAVSPSGRRVATAFGYGQGVKKLCVWDVESGSLREFDLPVPPPAANAAPTGHEGSIGSIGFIDDATLYTAGDGGVRRWNLDTGAHELVLPVAPDAPRMLALSADAREAISCPAPSEEAHRFSGATDANASARGSASAPGCTVTDLATRAARPLRGFGRTLAGWRAEGSLAVGVDDDGLLRVGRRDGTESHVLLGHSGPVMEAKISPDLRWLASSAEDKTLRLWPIPDLDRPPLHTLPHDALLARLKSSTNLRAVRDPKASTGWTIELGPFPGWNHLPTW